MPRYDPGLFGNGIYPRYAESSVAEVATVPDAPVEWASFSFQGGKKGLFENSTNLCQGTHKALVAFSGQNGKEHDFNPAVKAKCAKGRKGKSKRGR
jgi:hypothetical protein